MSGPTIAIYGGSFDPPHLGHVLSVTWTLAATEVDEVRVIPTWEHAFDKAHLAPFAARMRMCELAFSELASVTISDLERQLGGVSHTLRTLETLREQHPDDAFRLLVGADVLPTTHRWHRWDDIVRIAPPIVVGREGYPQPTGCPIAIPDVSSTGVRDALAQGASVEGLLPKAVVDYIAENGLYA